MVDVALFIPPDLKEMTEKGKESRGEGKQAGICGQACLAVLLHQSISQILESWKNQLEFKGYTGQRDLIKYLKNMGFEVKYKKKIENREASYIARIQWIGEGEKKEKPFYGWNHWTVSSSYTHYIFLAPSKGAFFCNETEGGWMNILDLEEYLKENNGVITSFLEIKETAHNV